MVKLVAVSPLMSSSWPGNPKVRQQDSPLAVLWIGKQDIRRFDVAVQEPALVGVIEGRGHRGDDGAHVPHWHPGRIAGVHQLRGVGSLDIVHREPQLTVELAAIMHLRQCSGATAWRPGRLRGETSPEVAVRRYRSREDLQRVAPRQPGVLSEIDLAHPARTQQPQDGVPVKCLPPLTACADSTAASARALKSGDPVAVRMKRPYGRGERDVQRVNDSGLSVADPGYGVDRAHARGQQPVIVVALAGTMPDFEFHIDSSVRRR